MVPPPPKDGAARPGDPALWAEHGFLAEHRDQVREVLEEQRDAIIEAGTSWVVETAIDLKGQRPRDETRRLVARVVDANVARLIDGDHEPQRQFIEFVTSYRASDQFHISTLIRGFLSFKKGVQHILPTSGLPPSEQLQLLMLIDACSRDSVLQMSDLYVGKLSEGLRDSLDPSTSQSRPKAERVTELVTELLEGSGDAARVGRYVVEGVIGRGGMGTVLEAYDERLDRKVALKLLHAELGGRHAQRLLREAKALAKLSHPNVVQVYEADEDHGQTFIAMELVSGQTLREWQAPGRPWRECVELYAQAGAGLAAAHAVGLTHRDFKPENCIVDANGRVRVLDFGLVRGIDEGLESERVDTSGLTHDEETSRVTHTETGAIVGTLAYMPLEQIEGGIADAHSDQFSFCVALYEALYGERPFASRSMQLRMLALLSERTRDPPKGARVPARLRRILLRGLRREPDARWSSMDELLEQLAALSRPRRMGPMVAAMAIAGLAVTPLWLDGPGTEPDVAVEHPLTDPIEESARAARAAADRALYLYPPPDDPGARTAYLEIVELEANAERLGPRALEVATQLRAEMALALCKLGNHYFDRPSTRALAVEYYAATLVFDPLDRQAQLRASITPLALRELSHAAANATFARTELEAKEPLRVLALGHRHGASDS